MEQLFINDNNNISKLENLPIFIHDNNINKLENLPNIYIFIHDNNINKLENLPNILRRLEICNNNIL